MYICVCVCIYIQICIYICIHIYIHTNNINKHVNRGQPKSKCLYFMRKYNKYIQASESSRPRTTGVCDNEI